MSGNVDWLEVKKCRQCGKKFTVLYPSMWRYQLREHSTRRMWFCTWGCIQAYRRGKEAKEVKRTGLSRAETAEALVEAMEAGRDPLEFLRERGYADPAKAYENMKQYCREKNHELLARFPKKRAQVKKPEADRISEATILTAVEKHGAGDEETKIIRGAGAYQTTGVYVEGLGEFYRDRKHDTIDWRTLAGDEVSEAPAGWRLLREELADIMRELGVEI